MIMNSGFLNAIILVFKNYFERSGRSSRAEYWCFMLFYWFISLFVGYLISTISADDNVVLVLSFLSGLLMIFLIIPSVFLGIRRLHDINRKGLWLLIELIPIINILLLVWFCSKGDDSSNRFGNKPSDIKITLFDKVLIIFMITICIVLFFAPYVGQA
ncbi:MAG: DUF805 domain-containing protein [Rickettsiaceae bacterium]